MAQAGIGTKTDGSKMESRSSVIFPLIAPWLPGCGDHCKSNVLRFKAFASPWLNSKGVVAASKGTKRFQYFDGKISFIAKRCKYAPILPPENFLLACTGAIIGTSSNLLLIWWAQRCRRLPVPLAPRRPPTLFSRAACWGSIARWSPCSQAPPPAAPDLIDLPLQLGHRRLSGGPARRHPFPVPSLQIPIGSLPLTGSASRRAMPLGSWMSRQSRVGPMNSKV